VTHRDPSKGTSPGSAPAEKANGPIGVVLAGGGARGAYQLGVLSELLPRLDERPKIYVGTSIGGLQAAYFAARAHDPLDEVLKCGVKLWQELGLRNAVSSPFSLSQARLTLQYLACAAGLPFRPPPSFLAAGPLKRSIEGIGQKYQFHRIQENVQKGNLLAAAVVATASATGRSVVFHDGGHPCADNRRGIDYVPTELTSEHVRASSAIASAFPAVSLGEPARWYVDGGARLNAPIKPAIDLGAERLIVVGLNSPHRPPEESPDRRPDALDGAGHLTQAILADPLHADIQTLVTLNRLTDPGRQEAPTHKQIPYIFITPAHNAQIGEVAKAVFHDHYTGFHGLRSRSRRIRFAGRLVDADGSPEHGELLSYLFFAREFVDELIELGKQHACDWMKAQHDRYPWRLLDPPAPISSDPACKGHARAAARPARP
jgi:NTE family protein